MNNHKDSYFRMNWVNRKMGNPLQVIDSWPDTLWLGVWNDARADLDAIRDYLTSDTAIVSAIVPASQCVTIRESLASSFSHVVRIDRKVATRCGDDCCVCRHMEPCPLEDQN